MVDLGGYAGVREKGLLKLEGKEYLVKDGDVLVIRHSDPTGSGRSTASMVRPLKPATCPTTP